VIQEGSLQANVDCLYLLRVRAEDQEQRRVELEEGIDVERRVVAVP
jgi:hypothetical protein